MSIHRRIAGLVSLLAFGIGAAAWFATQGNASRDRGPEPKTIEQYRQMPAAEISSLDDARVELPADVDNAFRLTGVSVEDVVASRTVETAAGATAVLSELSDGTVLLSVTHRGSGRVSTASAPAAAVADGKLFVRVSGPETGSAHVLVGVVPDGVEAVTVDDGNSTHQVEVASNVYAFRGDGARTSASWEYRGAKVLSGARQPGTR